MAASAALVRGVIRLLEPQARAKALLFTEGYLDTDYTFLGAKAAPGVVKLEDLKGKTLAVNKGSNYEAWARENAEKYGFKVDVYGGNADAVQAILAGRADYNLAGTTVVAVGPQGMILRGELPAPPVASAAGRLITPEDDQPSAPPVVVISYRYWQRRFGGESAAIGKTITVNGVPVRWPLLSTSPSLLW